MKNCCEYEIKCSYVEIYNDLVYDLLGKSQKMGENLQIIQGHGGDFIIQDVNEIKVDTFQEALLKMSEGESNRRYASTVMNHKSSRSHTIFKLVIKFFKK